MGGLFLKRVFVPLALFAIIALLGLMFLSIGEQRQSRAFGSSAELAP